jgi:hypothetical protein
LNGFDCKLLWSAVTASKLPNHPKSRKHQGAPQLFAKINDELDFAEAGWQK